MPHIPLVRANCLNGVIAFLEEIGAPTHRLLTRAKLPPAILQESEALIPLKLVLEFFETIAHTEGVEAFGWLVGQRTPIAKLGAMGRLLCHSLTLHDALQTVIRLLPTYNSGDRMWLVERGEHLWICRRFMPGLDQDHQQADFCSIVVMINLIRLAAGSQWKPTEIYLETNYIRGLDQIELLSDTRIHFGQAETAVGLPRSLINLPLTNAGDYQESQRRQDYETLYSSAPATSFAESLRQIIGSFLHQGYPDIPMVAEISNMSIRSFQRQLSELDLTYSQLVEEVRFEHAVQRLKDHTIKLTDIAAELGYKNAANFTRAFRRWTGVSPSKFRDTR